MRNPLVYIIILCWNGKKWLQECLSSVLSTQYSNFHVLLIDNGSTDGSKEYVRKNFPEVELLVNKKNLGYAEGNNRGIRLALKRKADYIVILNQDIKVEPDWLENLIEVAEKEKSFGILSPMQYNYEGTALDKHFENLINQNSEFQKNYKSNNLKSIYEVPWVIGASMLIKREVCEKVGLFDPIYFCYHEEADLCRRTRYYGFKIGIVTKSKVYHWHRLVHKGNKKNKKLTYLFYRNMGISMLKDPFNSFYTNLKSYFVWGGAKNIIKAIYKDTGSILMAIFMQMWIVIHLPLIFYKRYKEKRTACYLL